MVLMKNMACPHCGAVQVPFGDPDSRLTIPAVTRRIGVYHGRYYCKACKSKW